MTDRIFETILNVLLKENTNKEVSETTEEITEAAETAYSNSEVDVYEVKTFEQAKELAAGTKWGIQEKRIFDMYMKANSKFYIIVSKNNPKKKYVFWYNTDGSKVTRNVFANSDESLRLEDFNKLPDKYHEMLKDFSGYKKMLSMTGSETVSEAAEAPGKPAYSNADVDIYKVKSYEQAKELAADTAWGIKTKRLYDMYMKEGSQFFVIVPKSSKKKKYALYFSVKDGKIAKNLFVNSNESLKLENFDQLPNRYHDMIKDFPPYQRMIKMKSKK